MNEHNADYDAAFERGVRQAIEWLRADYEYGTGPDWREMGAEWIAEQAAERRRAMSQQPDFSQLARESPYARDEWQQAWRNLHEQDFLAAWPTLLALVRSHCGPPAIAVQQLLNAHAIASTDAGLCSEFINTGQCGHSDIEHDAMADQPSEGYLVLDSTVYSAVLQGATVIASAGDSAKRP